MKQLRQPVFLSLEQPTVSARDCEICADVYRGELVPLVALNIDDCQALFCLLLSLKRINKNKFSLLSFSSQNRLHDSVHRVDEQETKRLKG